MKKIINCETGEIAERELNEEELAQQAIDEAAATTRKAEEVSKAQARQTLLTKLGITEEEAKLLLS